MAWAGDFEQTLGWRSLEHGGVEHLRVHGTGGQVLATGAVTAEHDGARYQVDYQVHCDEAWRVGELRVRLADGAASCLLMSDGMGNWTGADGVRRPELAGCKDVDIAVTPFSNTLPIRRLNLGPGESAAIRVVYVPVPSLAPVAVGQRYTCLEKYRRYLYEGLDNGFSVELTVDRFGLVIDYPGLFERLD